MLVLRRDSNEAEDEDQRRNVEKGPSNKKMAKAQARPTFSICFGLVWKRTSSHKADQYAVSKCRAPYFLHIAWAPVFLSNNCNLIGYSSEVC